MIIGNFTYDPERDSYAGSIRTLSFERARVQIRPSKKNGDKDPDYRVIEDSGNGVIELGAAWSRRSEKGTAFLSVLLDCPGMAQPLSVALFNNGQGEANLVWTRPRARASEPGQAQSVELETAERPATARTSAQRRRRANEGDNLHA